MTRYLRYNLLRLVARLLPAWYREERVAWKLDRGGR